MDNFSAGGNTGVKQQLSCAYQGMDAHRRRNAKSCMFHWFSICCTRMYHTAPLLHRTKDMMLLTHDRFFFKTCEVYKCHLQNYNRGRANTNKRLL